MPGPRGPKGWKKRGGATASAGAKTASPKASFQRPQYTTGPNDRAKITLDNGQIVRLSPNSVFNAGPAPVDTKTPLQKLWTILQGGSLTPQKPSGVTAVRGSLLPSEVQPQYNTNVHASPIRLGGATGTVSGSSGGIQPQPVEPQPIGGGPDFGSGFDPLNPYKDMNFLDPSTIAPQVLRAVNPRFTSPGVGEATRGGYQPTPQPVKNIANPISPEYKAAAQNAQLMVPWGELRHEGLPDLGVKPGQFGVQSAGWPVAALNTALPAPTTQTQGSGYGYRRRRGWGRTATSPAIKQQPQGNVNTPLTNWSF